MAERTARPQESLPDVEEKPRLGLLEDFAPPSMEDWRRLVDEDLKGADFERRLVWKSPDGVTVRPLYVRADVADLEHTDCLPGMAPFVRGTQPLSGVLPAWQIRQDCLLASPEEVNSAIRDGIARGQTAVGIRLDNAARKGLDGDDPTARDIVGQGGCTISSINGLRIALQDIDFERHPVTIRTGSAALPVLAMLIALADERRVNRRFLTGGVECDPLRDLAKSGSVKGGLKLQYRLMEDIVRFCRRECPGIRGVMVNGHLYHNAGAALVDELAMVLAVGAEYVRELMKRGVSADDAGLGMLFSISVSTNFFMEVAKLRAARMLWAKIMRAFGARSEDAQKMFLHVRTSTFTKTIHDPYTNMLRNAVEAFAGAVGGCDSMYVAPFDETIGRADEFGMRVARNQQLLLQEEAHLNKVVDPAAGSYYVENLTDSVARAAWEVFQQIEAKGGMVAALKEGWIQARVHEAAARKRKLVTLRRQPIVGVSNYANPKEKRIAKQHLARVEFIEERQRRLSRLKSVRSNAYVRDLLLSLTGLVAGGNGNIVELAIEAAREGATIAEMTAAFVAGSEGDEITVETIKTERASVPFERLRARSDQWAARNGGLPKVFLVPMGPLAMRRARADFCWGFFGAGGFEVVEPTPPKTVEDAVKSMVDSGALMAVLCSDDASYPELAKEFVPALKAIKPDVPVYVAGYPTDAIEQLKADGVDGFVHIKADVVETLEELQKQLGI
jgi:methylmalonyl-CoA mutase